MFARPLHDRKPARRRASSDPPPRPVSDKSLWPFGGGKGISLAIEDWPRRDVVRLRQARDPLRATPCDQQFAPIKPSSWNAYLYAFAFFLGVLKRIDPAAVDLPLAERVTLESVHRVIWRMSYEGRYRNTGVGCYLHALRMALRRLDPETDWGWMHRLEKFYRFHAERRDLGKSHRSTREILDLGLDMMDRARADLSGCTVRLKRRRHLLQYRNGCIIGLLALLPLRRSNAAGLTTDRTLEVDEDELDILIPAADHKTKDDLLRSVPDALVEPIAFFINSVRPELMGAKVHDRLWPANDGDPLGSYGLYLVIVRVTARAWNVALFPHYLRSAAATAAAIASDDPSLAWRVNGRRSSRNDPCYVHRRLLEVSTKTGATIAGYREPEGP